jgi:hypothetical protein
MAVKQADKNYKKRKTHYVHSTVQLIVSILPKVLIYEEITKIVNIKKQG